MGRFSDEVILVTGAGGGIGSQAARALAQAGARLVLTDRDGAALEKLAMSLSGETVSIVGDVADEDHHRRLVSLAVETFGRLDVAINNAGIGQSYVKLENIPSNEAGRIVEVNVMGVFYAMKHQLPQMIRQTRQGGDGGRIVNIASVAGISGAPKLALYSASKHAVVGLTKSAALEYARRRIRINAVCPSYTRTSMVSDFYEFYNGSEADAEAELTRGVPMRRLAEVDEIVEVILFAADRRNSFMTGQALAADGGISAI